MVPTVSCLVDCRKLSLTEVQTSDITFPISPCACCHLHWAYSTTFFNRSVTQAHLSQMCTSATSAILFAALRLDATCRCEGLHTITSHPFCEPDWAHGNHFVPTIDWLWPYIYTWLESFKYNKFKLAGRVWFSKCGWKQVRAGPASEKRPGKGCNLYQLHINIGLDNKSNLHCIIKCL